MFTRWKIIAACLLAVVSAAAGVRGGEVAAQPQNCPDLYVVAVPGTWETSHSDPGKGMLALIADRLPGNVRTDYVQYAATAFPWEGEVYGRSKREALDAARGLVAGVAHTCAATRIAVLGYSQGADAAGDLAAEIGTGLGVVAAHRVVLVGLIADPRRSPTDTLIGPPVPGAGAAGPRLGGFGLLTPRTYTFCATGDLYCTMPDSDIAGFTVQLSNPDPAAIGSYHQQMADIFGDALEAGGLGVLTEELTPSAYQQRRQQIGDFLKSGAHQSYPNYPIDSVGNTPLSWLRQRLLEVIHGPG
ncbi:cutinase family protein [Nocardia sp. NPDC024068]|uniref:cutinase family protein n=1 Tax=Nocardia sp. NPDC024068 TaxID=3157197 RepID=UPI0033FBCF48